MKRLSLFIIFLLTCRAAATGETVVPPREANAIRIMSYNTHNFVGTDGVRDYDRIADVINAVAPDVVAIQEADSATTRSDGAYTLREVAGRTLMFATYAPAIDFQGGRYGVGILSRERPLSVRRIPLPGREESRVLLVAEFGRYVLACTHFSLTPEDRLASVDVVNRAVRGTDKPLFLAGDMNFVPGSAPFRALSASFTVLNDTAAHTSPADAPRRCIDYVFGYNNGRRYAVLRRQVVDEPVASDHRPLFVDVRPAADPSAVFRTKPYLQNPFDGGISITWFTSVPAHGWVEYGADPSMLRKAEDVADGQVVCNTTRHRIRLTGLRPGATYCYRVCAREITLYRAYRKEFGDTVRSNIYTFRIPDAADDFTALVFNDLHKRQDVLDRLHAQVEGTDYDFTIFNGDCIDDPADEDEAIGFLSRMNEAVRAETHPVVFLRGNHEIRNAYSLRMRELLDYAGSSTFGAFSWGDTRFVLLDCGEDKPDSTWVYYGLNDFDALRREQADFLREELSSKAFKRATRRALIHHIPLYGMGDGAYNPCLALWGGLLAGAPFDICLNGHTHRHAYHPAGTAGNRFPVMIGGGNRVETATVMILRKKKKALSLKVVHANGETLHDLTF
ncbi:MAG: endonuclease/exonuclease/phosphatase family protein [Tannerella sp.]|jgi:endonuclease/exonuclease/phosphatase family metal-dependent hydrolase/predicted phosphodiesterase|nr:endonuclease/exonuclease/phosphatase family protein [Tannerella sp.]